MTAPDPADSNTAAFLGLRLRALDQVVSAQGRELLNAFGAQTPNVCVSVLHFVGLNQPVTVTEIVTVLSISRQVVLQRLKLLEAQGLIESTVDENDRRSRLIRLTRAGEKEERLLRDVLVKIDAAFEDLHEELGANLSALLNAAAHHLRKRSLIERVEEQKSRPKKRKRRIAARQIKEAYT